MSSTKNYLKGIERFNIKRDGLVKLLNDPDLGAISSLQQTDDKKPSSSKKQRKSESKHHRHQSPPPKKDSLKASKRISKRPRPSSSTQLKSNQKEILLHKVEDHYIDICHKQLYVFEDIDKKPREELPPTPTRADKSSNARHDDNTKQEGRSSRKSHPSVDKDISSKRRTIPEDRHHQSSKLEPRIIPPSKPRKKLTPHHLNDNDLNRKSSPKQRNVSPVAYKDRDHRLEKKNSRIHRHSHHEERGQRKRTDSRERRRTINSVPDHEAPARNKRKRDSINEDELDILEDYISNDKKQNKRQSKSRKISSDSEMSDEISRPSSDRRVNHEERKSQKEGKQRRHSSKIRPHVKGKHHESRNEAKPTDLNVELKLRVRKPIHHESMTARKDKNEIQENIIHTEESNIKEKYEKCMSCLLEFARGSESIQIETSHDSISFRKLRLSIIKGCEDLAQVYILEYIDALLRIHVKAVQETLRKKDKSQTPFNALQNLSTKGKEDAWKEKFSSNSTSSTEEDQVVPPMLIKTVDAIKFILRVSQRVMSLDQSIHKRFLTYWYTLHIPKYIAILIHQILSFWRKNKFILENEEESICETVEWCTRLFVFSASLELNSKYDLSAIPKIHDKLLFLANLRDGDTILFHDIVDTAYDYLELVPNKSGREYKQGLSEIAQLYEKLSRQEWKQGNLVRKQWKELEQSCSTFIDRLAARPIFWTTCVQPLLQQMLNQEELFDAAESMAFIYTILNNSESFRHLLKAEEKCRHVLGELVLRIIERLARDPVQFWLEISKRQTRLPGIQYLSKLLVKLMSSSILQREFISSDTAMKDRYFDCLDNAIMRSAKLVKGCLSQEILTGLANAGPFSKRKSDFSILFHTEEANYRRLGGISQGMIACRQNTLSLMLLLIGFLGKSMENGEWDFTHMNSIKTLLSSRFNSFRKLLRLWEDVIKIRGTLENLNHQNLNQKDDTHLVISTEDRNRFSMVVEYVRKQLLQQLKKADISSLSTKRKTIENGATSLLSDIDIPRGITISLPNITKVPALREAASTKKGHIDLDMDTYILSTIAKELKNSAEETLARYDSDWDDTARWTKLSRKNSYIEDAKNLLEKEDKATGQNCHCVPSNPRENGEDRNRLVACSNDLCENRQMKIECVPGNCGSGNYCRNQRLQNREYAKFRVGKAPGKGAGLFAESKISVGTLIGEYQGEVISTELFEKRKKEYQGEKHFYFMTLTNKLVIDASRKSQATRFANHSCDPNCETQKWNSGGEPRVGIFAIRDIQKGEEITFDYGARSLANDSIPCLCGSKKCRGWLMKHQDDDDGTEEDQNDKDEVAERGNDTEIKKKSATDADSSELESDVDNKIRKARNNLESAKQLETRILDMKMSCQTFNEKGLNFVERQRLRDWEQAMTRKKSIPNPKPANNLKDLRIPRKSVAASSKERRSLTKRQQPPTNPYEAIINKSRSTQFLSSSVRSKLTADRKSATPNLRQEQMIPPGKSVQKGLFRPSRSSADERQVSKPQNEPASKAPSAWRGRAFQPATAKQRRRPKWAPRKRKRQRVDDEVDSMDGYSTASSIEPIMVIAPLSPREMPDSKGACSDDEFTEAPPIGNDLYENPRKERNEVPAVQVNRQHNNSYFQNQRQDEANVPAQARSNAAHFTHNGESNARHHHLARKHDESHGKNAHSTNPQLHHTKDSQRADVRGSMHNHTSKPDNSREWNRRESHFQFSRRNDRVPYGVRRAASWDNNKRPVGNHETRYSGDMRYQPPRERPMRHEKHEDRFNAASQNNARVNQQDVRLRRYDNPREYRQPFKGDANRKEVFKNEAINPVDEKPSDMKQRHRDEQNHSQRSHPHREDMRPDGMSRNQVTSKDGAESQVGSKQHQQDTISKDVDKVAQNRWNGNRVEQPKDESKQHQLDTKGHVEEVKDHKNDQKAKVENAAIKQEVVEKKHDNVDIHEKRMNRFNNGGDKQKPNVVIEKMNKERTNEGEIEKTKSEDTKVERMNVNERDSAIVNRNGSWNKKNRDRTSMYGNNPSIVPNSGGVMNGNGRMRNSMNGPRHGRWGRTLSQMPPLGDTNTNTSNPQAAGNQRATGIMRRLGTKNSGNSQGDNTNRPFHRRNNRHPQQNRRFSDQPSDNRMRRNRLDEPLGSNNDRRRRHTGNYRQPHEKR